MGLPIATITTGFSGLAESSAAHDTAAPRPQAAKPSPYGTTSNAESAGTQTPASPQSELGSDAASHYPLSDAAILSLQLRAMKGKPDVPAEKPKNSSGEETQPTDQLLDLSSQENDLESALSSMGMSQGAIQEFMYIGQVLAKAAPGLFQDFVAQVVNLADLYKQARLPGLGGPAALARDAKPQSELQMVSVQASQASVSLTQAPSRETLNVSAQQETLTVVNFEGGLSQIQSNSAAKPGTTATQSSSAPNPARASHRKHTAPAVQQA